MNLRLSVHHNRATTISTAARQQRTAAAEAKNGKQQIFMTHIDV